MVLETHHPAAVYSNWCTGSASKISWPMKMMGPSGTVSRWVCQCTAPPPGSIIRWLRSFLGSHLLEDPSAAVASVLLSLVGLPSMVLSPSPLVLLPFLLSEAEVFVLAALVSSQAATGKGLAFNALRWSTLK